jgi:hypothetical protein
MSTYKAIAVVTAALSELIASGVRSVLPGVRVTNLRPGVAALDSAAPSVNVFLYGAEPHAGLRNAADPVRHADGSWRERPVAAWTLNYVITCAGDEASLESSLLLGAVLTQLNANPVLTRGLVSEIEETLGQAQDSRRFASGSKLAEQTELVKLTPLALTLGDLTELWSALTKEPYSPSVVYVASLVSMSPNVSPAPRLPVTQPARVAVAPTSVPLVTSASDSAGSAAPLHIASRLVVRGERLRAAHAQLRLGTLDVDLPPDAASSDRIELSLSVDDGSGSPVPLALAPGVLAVQVRHRVNLAVAGNPPELRPGATSNVVPIVLRPTLLGASVVTNDADGARVISVAMAPPPQEQWEYQLLLSQLGTSPPRGVTLAPATPAVSEGRVLFPCDAVPAGEWLVRLDVNGAASVLDTSPGGAFTGPKVALA